MSSQDDAASNSSQSENKDEDKKKSAGNIWKPARKQNYVKSSVPQPKFQEGNFRAIVGHSHDSGHTAHGSYIYKDKKYKVEIWKYRELHGEDALDIIVNDVVLTVPMHKAILRFPRTTHAFGVANDLPYVRQWKHSWNGIENNHAQHVAQPCHLAKNKPKLRKMTPNPTEPLVARKRAFIPVNRQDPAHTQCGNIYAA